MFEKLFPRRCIHEAGVILVVYINIVKTDKLWEKAAIYNQFLSPKFGYQCIYVPEKWLKQVKEEMLN